MSTTDTSGATAATLPQGVWRVDPTASKLTFRSRGMFGLVPVKGTFGEFEGELTVDDAGAHGELRIASASLDTGNAKRDNHLRSKDFFHVKEHDTVTFSLANVAAAADGALTLTGTLAIRDNTLEFSSPLTAVSDGDKLKLSTDVSVDRAAAGVGWSKAGMIKGPALLGASLTLTKQD
jgi:polyisoprenoid-binding protein YceI